MPLNPVKVALAVQGGLSPVCATCQRYWEGRERNLPGDLCTTPRECGSPLAGMTYPAYLGPITDFTRWCFICSAEATYAVEVPGSTRLCGVCDNHLQALPEMRPVNMRATTPAHVADQMRVRTASGASHAPIRLIPKKRKTLTTLIADTEAEWAKERAARGDDSDGG